MLSWLAMAASSSATLSTAFVSLRHPQRRRLSPTFPRPPLLHPHPLLRNHNSRTLLRLQVSAAAGGGSSPILLHQHDHRPPPGSLPSFDVFLSFHGRDVRHTIVDHLYAALVREGVKPFKDDVEMRRGLEVKEAISAAIQGSSLHLLVLSGGYASSAFCLDEGFQIMQRCGGGGGGGGGVVALPIFYLVSPDDVCLPTAGCFKEHFVEHFANFTYARVQGWIDALTWLGNIAGWVHENGRSEALLVEEVSTTIGKMVREMRSTTASDSFTNYSTPVSSVLHLASSRSVHYDDQDMELKYFQPQISSTKGNDRIVRIPKPANHHQQQQDLAANPCLPHLCLVAEHYYYLHPGADQGDTVEEDVTAIATDARRLWKDDKIEVEPLTMIKTTFTTTGTCTDGTSTSTGNSNSILMMRFRSQETRNWVLESSPWVISGTQYFMRKWDSSEEPPSTVPVWVRLYNVPEEYMNPEGLSYIASALGKPIYVDRATADGFHRTGSSSQQTMIPPYAKVCVEISPKDEALISSYQPPAKRATMVIAIGDEKENVVVVNAVYQLEEYACPGGRRGRS